MRSALTPANPTNTTGDFGYVKYDPDLGKIGKPGVGGDGSRWRIRASKMARNGNRGGPRFYCATRGRGRSTRLPPARPGDYVFNGFAGGDLYRHGDRSIWHLGGLRRVTALGAAGVDFNNQAQPYTVVFCPRAARNQTAGLRLHPAGGGDWGLRLVRHGWRCAAGRG